MKLPSVQIAHGWAVLFYYQNEWDLYSPDRFNLISQLQ